uniref:Uncharacterized protein n=1 Tax=viral metagenome TaxID=1070528 RepID=A0A6M3JUW1_9ZZZZ
MGTEGAAGRVCEVSVQGEEKGRMNEWRTGLIAFIIMLVVLWVMFQIPPAAKLVDLPWGCRATDYVEPLMGLRGE